MAPIDAHTPVAHVSYFEADAYRALGRRARCRPRPSGSTRRAPRARRIAHGNFVDRGALHPLPPAQATAPRPVQLFGDVWEWTSRTYAPYPGYRPAHGAVGEYNGKFMCNQYVLRGGSCATPRRPHARQLPQLLPADARWQFSGLRLARDRAG